MKHIKLFEDFINESNEFTTVKLSAKAAFSFEKELKGNGIKYTKIRPTVFQVKAGPKTDMAIKMTKERFGSAEIIVEEFINEAITSSELVLQKHAIRMQKKYSIHEIGLIRAWGSTLYLAYYNLPKSGTMVPYKEYVKILSEYAVLDKYSDEYEDITDWISDLPPTIKKVPLWNQDRLQDDFNKMANKTPTDREITLYRTSKNERPGLNSYSLISGVYGDVVNQREYLLPKGTPIIWGHAIADLDEVIWSPTLAELKKYIVKR